MQIAHKKRSQTDMKWSGSAAQRTQSFDATTRLAAAKPGNQAPDYLSRQKMQDYVAQGAA